MEILERAIEAEGGVGRLATAIGAGSVNTVSMWRQRGRVPSGWLKVLELKYADTVAPIPGKAGNPTPAQAAPALQS